MNYSIKYIKNLLSFAIAFSSCVVANAQQETTLHFMNSVPQVVNNSPAFMPNWSFTFSLPVISSTSISYQNSGFAYKDIITRRAEDDSLVFDLPKLGRSLRDRNSLTKSLQTEIFGLGFRVNKLYFTLDASFKTFNDFNYSRAFLAFFAEGNTQYIGKTVEISPAFNSLTYGELALGAAYQINTSLTVGTRLKYLVGVANVNTQRSTFNLETDDRNYAVTVSGDAIVRTAGLRRYYDDKYESSLDPADMMANRGFGVDLGATYKVDEKLSLGLSILDLGAINWKNEAMQHTVVDSLSFTFSGMDLNASSGEGSEGGKMDLADSVMSLFTKKEISSYKTGLPTRFYLSANYKLLKNTQVGALFFGQDVYGRFRSAFSASVMQDVHRNFSANLSFTTTGFSNHVGGGLVFRVATMQFHIISDNIFTAALVPNNVKSLNARFGMNFTVGQKEKEDK